MTAIMLTAADVLGLLAGHAFAHVQNRAPDAKLPVRTKRGVVQQAV